MRFGGSKRQSFELIHRAGHPHDWRSTISQRLYLSCLETNDHYSSADEFERNLTLILVKDRGERVYSEAESQSAAVADYAMSDEAKRTAAIIAKSFCLRLLECSI